MAAIFTTVLAVGVAGVVVPAVGSPEPAGAAVEEFSLSLVEGGGLLELRDQEPYLLETPTTVSGEVDDETGVITGAEIATPTVSFEQDITEPVVTTVFIDAEFSNAAPAGGQVDFEGNLVVEASLTVELHVEAGSPPFLTGDCVATPIELQLQSTAPYDPDSGLVTLEDADFSVPEVIPQGCEALIQGPINDQLAGGGHAITLTFQGDLPLPPEPGEPSETTLVVEPEGGSRLGDEVSFMAEVEPGPDAETAETPTGFVDFQSGSTVLATRQLVDGAAELTTTALTIGDQTLTARYRGDATYGSSVSPDVPYSVSAVPLISADLPVTVTYGAEPVEFDLTVTNTPFGGDIENARVDFTIRRAQGTGTFTSDRVTLEYLDDQDEWQPVVLTQIATRTQNGHIGPTTGQLLANGDDLTHRLRLAFPDVGGTFSPTSCTSSRPTCPGPFEVTFDVLQVDLSDGEELAGLSSNSGEMLLVESERRPAVLNVIGGSTLPHTVRSGTTASILALTGPTFAGIRPTGEIAVRINGQPVGLRDPGIPVADGFSLPAVEIGTISNNVILDFLVPEGLGSGLHEVTILYSGDAFYEAGHFTIEMNVAPALPGSLVECGQGTHLNGNFILGGTLTASANVPSVVAADTEVSLSNLNVRLQTARPTFLADQLLPIPDGLIAVGDPIGTGGPGELQGIDLVLAPGGSGSAGALERIGGSVQPPPPVDPADIDQILKLHDAVGFVPVAGAPGTTLPITLEAVTINWTLDGGFPLPQELDCRPTGDAPLLGEVTIAGTLLSASTSSPQSGQDVTLTAEALPEAPGIMVFMNGTETMDVIPSDDGTASLTVNDLAIGANDITAQFFPTTLGIPSTTSDPVTVTVIDMDPAFSDVPEDSPFFDAIQWLAQEGITTGFPDGTFQPAAAISRDAVAAWLWRYAGEPVVDVPQQFSDVPPEHPFYAAIQWMADAGITTGFEDGTFQPASPIARDAVAAWLWRFAGEPEPTLEEPAFSDVPADHPFYEAVQWLAETEITTGFPDGTFQPAAEIERQAVAAWLFRLAQL